MDFRIGVLLVIAALMVAGCASKDATPPAEVAVADTVEPIQEEVVEETVVEEVAVDEAEEVGTTESLPTDTVVIHTDDGDLTIKVEVADTPEAREKGLMDHDPLEDNTGLLMVFDEEQEVSLWMKNVPFAIDAIFIGEDLEIKNLATMNPCSNYCPTWDSRGDVKYVLEVPMGFIKKNDIIRETKVSIT